MEAASNPTHCICYLAFPGAAQLLQPPSPVPLRGCGGDRPPPKVWPLLAGSLRPAALPYTCADLLILADISEFTIFDLIDPGTARQEKWPDATSELCREGQKHERKHVRPCRPPIKGSTYTQGKLTDELLQKLNFPSQTLLRAQSPTYGCSTRRVKTRPPGKWLRAADGKRRRTLYITAWTQLVPSSKNHSIKVCTAIIC